MKGNYAIPKKMKRSFVDPGKADARTGRRRAGRLTTKMRRSFDDPGKADEKLGGAEEQVG